MSTTDLDRGKCRSDGKFRIPGVECRSPPPGMSTVELPER